MLPKVFHFQKLTSEYVKLDLQKWIRFCKARLTKSHQILQSWTYKIVPDFVKLDLQKRIRSCDKRYFNLKLTSHKL